MSAASSNQAIFQQLLVRGGEIVEIQYREPFEMMFGLPRFELHRLERETGVSRSGAAYSAVEVRYRLAG
jgi:hypothetical protein